MMSERTKALMILVGFVLVGPALIGTILLGVAVFTHLVVLAGLVATLVQVVIVAAIILIAGGVAYLLGMGMARVKRAHTGPHYVFEKGDKKLRAVDQDGRVQFFPEQPLGNLASLSLHDSSRSHQEALPAPVVDEDVPAVTLRPVSYRDIAHLLPPGKELLGIAADGSPRLGDADRVKTRIVLGRSGAGKSVTMATRILRLAQAGGKLVVCDPHAHKADSLARKIAPLAAAFWPGSGLAIEAEDILLNIRLVREEIKRRLSGVAYDGDLLCVIDEYSTLYDDAEIREELVGLSKDLTRAGRGLQVYGEFGAQDMSGGMAARIRKLAQSVTIHRVDYGDAYMLLHDSQQAKQVMRLTPGASIVIDAYGEQELLQQPHITRADIEEAGRRLVRLDELPEMPRLPKKNISSPIVSSQGVSVSVPEVEVEKDPSDPKITVLRPTHTLTHKASKVSAEQRAYCLEHREDMSASAIAIMLWNDAHKNIWVRQVWQEADAAQEVDA